MYTSSWGLCSKLQICLSSSLLNISTWASQTPQVQHELLSTCSFCSLPHLSWWQIQPSGYSGKEALSHCGPSLALTYEIHSARKCRWLLTFRTYPGTMLFPPPLLPWGLRLPYLINILEDTNNFLTASRPASFLRDFQHSSQSEPCNV